MNLAIIIGVSEYKDPANNLPGCKNDTNIVFNILSKTEKFDNILLLDKNEESLVVKDKLANFIDLYKTEAIDECLFYFTGHGLFTTNEFYYILSNYDSNKKNQTSLQNTEIDNFLKTLKPNLVVKIIDACQSGTAYVKESGVLTKYLNENKNEFKNCYFLNSSLNTQSSYQSDDMSFFTKSFVNCIKEHSIGDIRYKTIIDYISDEFQSTDFQTPFFVTQASFTEKFCTKNAALNKYLNGLTSQVLESVGIKNKPTIVEIIKEESLDYCTKEQAMSLLDSLKEESNNFKIDNKIVDLYSLKVSFVNEYKEIPKRSSIGQWLVENKHSFFAKPLYKKIYENTLDAFRDSLANLDTLYGKKTPNQLSPINFKYKLDSYELQVEVPFIALSFDANAQYPNIASYNLTICFLLSKKTIRYFYFITNYIEEGWDSRDLLFINIEWKTVEVKLADSKIVINELNNIYNEFQIKIIKDLNDKYKISSE